MCGKPGGDFYDIYHLQNATCTEGIQCGSYPQTYCVQGVTQCPINHVIISDHRSDIPRDYDTRLMSDGKYLAFTTQASATPVVHLDLTEGEPCVISNEHDTSPGRYYSNALIKKSFYKGCETKLAG